MALRATDGSVGLGFMLIRDADAVFSTGFTPSWEKGFDGVVGCVAGGDCFDAGGGVELLEAGTADGCAVELEGVPAGDGPPSFASRFARI